MRNIPALFLIAGVLIAVPAQAAKEHAAAPATTDKASFLQARASELTGKPVVNPQGESLGRIEDLIIDVRRGAVQYAVVSFGGKLRLGHKLYVFPLNAFTRGENRDRVVLNAEPEALRQAQGFNKDNWPFDPPLRRATELRGKNVKDSDGKTAGEIEDLVVHMGSGRIEQVILAQNGRKGPDPKKALPLQAFQIAPQRGGEVVLREPNRR
jgi:sporulation protein YlmC with PRC-barrel domain